MAKYHPIALQFVGQYLEREPEYIDFTEFLHEYDDGGPLPKSEYTDPYIEISASDLYDQVPSILAAIRDRLDLITE